MLGISGVATIVDNTYRGESNPTDEIIMNKSGGYNQRKPGLWLIKSRKLLKVMMEK